MVHKLAIWWVRRDMRLTDNGALETALRNADTVLPVWIAESRGARTVSEAWAAISLRALDARLRSRGSRLIVREGAAPEVLATLAAECGATLVTGTSARTPAGSSSEAAVGRALEAIGVNFVLAGDLYLVEPDALCTGTGGPYRVFTPYYRAWRSNWGSAMPHATPERLRGPDEWPPSAELPSVTGGPDLAAHWQPGETSAVTRLGALVSGGPLRCYAKEHDRPDRDCVSRLSPHLAAGELSPRQVAWVVRAAEDRGDVAREDAEAFLRQLAWREFAAHVLHHFPHTETEPLHAEFAAMPWTDDPRLLARWEAGETGYDLVDAGMRELAETGWIHNRVRLVVGSFLAKHLMLRWQEGERSFRERLCDLDVASNVFNWQWVAGCGADAAPYHRVFNPYVQAQRFDGEGAYRRRWLPEGTRPDPIVDHREARARVVSAYEAVRAAR